MKKKRIKRLLRPLIQRTFAPATVQYLRFRWWYLSSWLPRILTSGVRRREPRVQHFGAAPVRSLQHLASVNLLAPTKACRVMTKWGSDKAWNSYTPVYAALFGERRDEPLRILELGMGTNNLDVLSNMGVFGAPGASHRGWREIFPQAQVYGADIDRRILFEEDRIKTFYCDQLDPVSIRELWSHPELRAGADIIIEDGLHTLEANISFLEGSLSYLRPGGTYVIEDIGATHFNEWCDRLETMYAKQYPAYEFAFVTLSDPGSNNMLVVRRATE